MPVRLCTAKVQSLLRPKLTDLGLNMEKTPLGYVNITSTRMMLDQGAETRNFKSPEYANYQHDILVQPAFTYLANTIADGGREIPYSTITAIDFSDQPPLGPFLSADGKPLPPLKDDEIALNSWAADELKAKLGDRIDVSYFEPESSGGQIQRKHKNISPGGRGATGRTRPTIAHLRPRSKA